MPVHNEAAFIERSVGSVLAQDYPHERMEILIADGLSQDGTRQIISGLQPQQSIIEIVDSIKRVGALALPRDPMQNPEVEVWRDTHGGVSAYAEILGDEYRMHLPGLASFSFSPSGHEVAAAVPLSVREELVVDAYRRKVLPMALQVGGREVLHSSAVRSASGVTALCGVSEAGKSTIAFGLSRRGYSLWADDTVAFEISESGGSSILLPFNVRLRPASAAHFDVDESRPADGLAHLSLPLGHETAPLTTVCILRRADCTQSPVAVRRLSLAEAFSAALDHACCFIPQTDQRKRRMIHNYLDLAAQTPFFDICFQPGLENVPAILDAIEAVLKEAVPRA
jgi:hypothetical protein